MHIYCKSHGSLLLMLYATLAIVVAAALVPSHRRIVRAHEVFQQLEIKYRSSFTLVGTAKPSFGQDVTIHRAQQFPLGCAGLQ